MRALLGKSSALLLAILLLSVNLISAAPVADNSTSSSEEDSTTEVADQQQQDDGVDSPLEGSLESFLALIPSDKIQNMTAEAYLESAVAREASNFLRTREFRDAKDKLLEAPEVQEFVKFLNQSGLNLIRFVRKVGNRTGIPVTIRDGAGGAESSENSSSEEEAAVVASSEAATVLTQLVDKLLAELPQEQFFAVFFEKMESDSEMSEFVERLNGDEFEAILLKVQVNSAAQRSPHSLSRPQVDRIHFVDISLFLVLLLLLGARRSRRHWTSSRRQCWTIT